MFFTKALRRPLLSSPRCRTAWRRTLATVADPFKIPIIEFDRYIQASSGSEKKGVADEIVSPFSDFQAARSSNFSFRSMPSKKASGFIYLKNHGIPEDVVQNVYRQSAQFFELPPEVKDLSRWEDPRSNRGYVQIGRERVTQSIDATEIAALREKAPDCKESMEIGRDWESEWKNQWPAEDQAPGFKETMLNFYETCHNLHVKVMRSIALGLDLSEDFFDEKINEQCHNLRLLSYPAIKTSLLEKEGQARAGAHSDYGTLTLLFQDSVGGLQVQNPNTGEYVAATPVPGTIVVNVGDLLSRWSNDTLRSTLHRVVAPPADKISDELAQTPKRQSIAFFSNPNFSATISCLPNCGQPRYDPVNTEQYIVRRLSETYT